MIGESGRRVADWIDELQSGGRYTLSLEEIEHHVGGSPAARRSAVRRLKEKARLVSPRRGFLVIVPVEYRSAGSPPASWFVDDLMRYLDQPYYVGLLSAAAIHGAAHQQPQIFQVVTTRPTPPMAAGRVRLEFFRKRALERVTTLRTKTETGTIAVSTPEATLFDLLRHVQAVGYLNNVATVLSELAEAMAPKTLADAAGAARITEIQRAGYLFELLGHDELARPLEKILARRRSRPTLLAPDLESDAGPRNERWNLVLNERVEPDL